MENKVRGIGTTLVLGASLATSTYTRADETSLSTQVTEVGHDVLPQSTDSPQPFKLDLSLPFEVFAFSGFHTRYRAMEGFTLSDGAVNQSYIGVTLKDVFTTGDSITPSVWTNVDLDRGTLSEIDGVINYTLPLVDEFLGGKLNGSLELALWDYPDKFLGTRPDVALTGRFLYEGFLNAELKGVQMLNGGHGRALDLFISKSLELGTLGDATFTLTPSISTSYLSDYFGIDGLSNVQFGATLGINLGNFNLDGYVRYQQAFENSFESGPVAGLQLSIEF